MLIITRGLGAQSLIITRGYGSGESYVEVLAAYTFYRRALKTIVQLSKVDTMSQRKKQENQLIQRRSLNKLVEYATTLRLIRRETINRLFGGTKRDV